MNDKVKVPQGSIIWCSRTPYWVVETPEQIDAAIRYALNPDDADLHPSDDALWRMTDGPPGFIQIRRPNEPGETRLAVASISSYEVRWVDAD